jgi:hypothetical protein
MWCLWWMFLCNKLCPLVHMQLYTKSLSPLQSLVLHAVGGPVGVGSPTSFLCFELRSAPRNRIPAGRWPCSRTWWWLAETWSSTGWPGCPPVGTSRAGRLCLSLAALAGRGAGWQREEGLVVPIAAAGNVPRPAAPHVDHNSVLCCLPNLHLPVSSLPPSSSPPWIPPKSPLLIYVCTVGK